RRRQFSEQVVKKASIFLEISITIARMPNTKTTPIILIVAAVAVAGGIALYLSRQGAQAGGDGTSGDTKSALGGGHVRGVPEAPITLVEYGDFQCPTCGLYHPILDELLSRYNGKLKLEYHHFPLVSIHPNALAAAIAAEAAAEQGKFWEMHDMLYEHQQEGPPSTNAETNLVQEALT